CFAGRLVCAAVGRLGSGRGWTGAVAQNSGWRTRGRSGRPEYRSPSGFDLGRCRPAGLPRGGGHLEADRSAAAEDAEARAAGHVDPGRAGRSAAEQVRAPDPQGVLVRPEKADEGGCRRATTTESVATGLAELDRESRRGVRQPEPARGPRGPRGGWHGSPPRQP